MKVAIYTSNLSPDVGGGYTFEQEIIEALRLLAPKYPQFELVFIDVKPNVTTSTQKVTRSLRRFIRMVLPQAMVDYIRNNRPQSTNATENAAMDFINGNSIDILLNIIPGQSFSLDIPFIQIVWDLQHRRQPFFPEVSYGHEWDYREVNFSRVLRRAAIIITPNQTGKAEIENYYQIPAERIRCLPHPTPTFALTPPIIDAEAILRKYQLKAGFLFYPAQMWPHKNHIALLKTLEILCKEYALQYELVLVGSDKGNLQYIRSQVRKLQLERQVHFLGLVSRNELIALYQNAFALTYVTYFGPENLPPLEAFALGCPVIASMVAGASEQLQDAPLYCDPKEPRSIALAIKKLHDEPHLRVDMIARGKKQARTFTSNDFASGLFEIFQQLQPYRNCWGKAA